VPIGPAEFKLGLSGIERLSLQLRLLVSFLGQKRNLAFPVLALHLVVRAVQ